MSAKKLLIGFVLAAICIASLIVSCNSPLFGIGGRVDMEVPGVKIETVDEGSGARTLVNGDYVRGTIILKGTASDDIAVSSVTLTFTEGSSTVTTPATISDTAWQATINTTQYTDGPKDFVITVADNAGKTTETRFVIYFDNKPPVVMFTLIGNEADYNVNPLWGKIMIKGSAADQFGIRKVRIYIHKKTGDGTGTLVYASPDDATIGTNFFSITLAPSQYSNLGDLGNEDAYFSVQAFDRSGNETSWFYISGDLSGLVIEDILALENGSVGSVNGFDLNTLAAKRRRAPNKGFTGSSLLSYFFDQTANLPIVTISNPEQGKTAGENIISKNAKASGVVQDANGVAKIELQFRKETTPGNYDESVWYVDNDVNNPGGDIDVSGTGQVVNWVSKTLFGNFSVNGSTIKDGVYDLRIRATDADNNSSTSDWVHFTIDADAPEITIISPQAGDYKNGNPVVISGTAESFGTSYINSGGIEVYIDATHGYEAAVIDSGTGTKNVNWHYNITQASFPTDGVFTVKSRVTDTGGKSTINNIVITVDRTLPSALTISSPGSGTSVNGYKTFRGTANDNILLDKVYIVFEKNGEEILLDDTYSWSYSMDVDTLANTTYGYDMGSNVYRVPIRLKAVDKAGNTAYTTSMGSNPNSPAPGSYYIDADPDGDRPTITQVLAPGNFGNTYSTSYQIPGSIKVQGIASDDDAVHHVEMALMAIFDGTTERYCQQLTGAPGSITVTTTETWITIDGASLWYKILNNSGELYDLASATGSPGGTHNGNFRIRLRAVDTKDNTTPDVTGNEVELYVRFDNTLPAVTGITPEENTVQKGIFNFQFTAQDNVKVTAAQISYNNGGSYTPIAITPAQSIPISISIDTTTINSGQFNDSAGTLNLRIKLTDDSNNISERNIKYLIDNILPTATLTTDVSDINNKMIDHTTNLANILGTANDTGAVKGVSKVEVWFERSSVQIFPASGHVIIDRNENYVDGAAGGAGEPDGYPESFTQNSGGWQWGFRFNSSPITDGDITVHYIVFDEAGNSQEYTAPGAIKNNKPNLSAIVLETDRNGDSDTTDDEERVRLERQTDINGDYTNTWKRFVLDGAGTKKDSGAVFDMSTSALTVMNSRFTASFELASGNGTKYYYALAPNGSTELLNWVNTTNYTVTDFGTGGWSENANNTLSIRVRDSAFGTPLETAMQTFVVYVDNSDNIPPEVRLNQLSATDIKGYDPNNRAAWEGHVEPWNQSPWNNQNSGFDKTNEYFGNDADVSGTVIFSGTASDDQRIQNLYIWIDLDGDNTVDAGEEAAVASFSGSDLVPQANALGTWSATSQTLNANGHSVSWTFEWNSAIGGDGSHGVSGVARSNVRVRARATDFGTNPSPQLPASPTDTTSLAGGFNITKVDVVPYITSLQTPYRTEGGLKDNNIRSSSGKYSVITGSNNAFITISGFNLNPNAVRVVDTGSLAGATDVTGVGLTYGAPNGSYTSVDISNASTASGYLEVFTNSVRSLNNIDNNALPTNCEPDQYVLKNNRLTNDRYLRFFTIRSTGIKNAYYPDMEMEGNDPVFGYLNLSGGFNGTVSLLDPTDDATHGAGSYYPSHAMPQRAKFTAAGVQVYKEYLIKASIWDQMAMAKDAGNRYYHITVYNRDTCAMSFLYDRYAELYTNGQGWGSGTTYSGYGGNVSHNPTNNALTLERVDFGNGLLLGRYIYPKLQVKGNSSTGNASVYAVYYDDNTTNRDLIFRTFQVGTGALGNALANAGTAQDGNTYAQNTNLTENATNDAAYGTGRITAASSASKHFDFGVTSTNRIVVVYYDEFAGRLKMVYSNAAVDGSAPTTDPGWTTSSISFPSYVGNYVSVTIDSSDGIHIAAYDSNESNLVYMFISDYASTTLYTATVDQAFAVGNWTQIKLFPGTTIPYIAYYNATETGGRDPIKLAFCNSPITTLNVPAGVDNNGFVTGNWEFMTVPALTPPQGGSLSFKHVNLGFNSSNVPVISYLGTNLEFGFWLSE